MKVLFCIIIACLIGLSSQIINGQDNDARVQIKKIMNIVPAESHADDVKTHLCDPTDESGFYSLNGVNVQISYASGLPCDAPCFEKGRAGSWLVPRDTVITIAVFVKVAFDQKDLGYLNINLSSYTKGKPDHTGAVRYLNDEVGIGVTLNGSQVSIISIFPAKKYFHLMCPKSPDKPVCPRQLT